MVRFIQRQEFRGRRGAGESGVKGMIETLVENAQRLKQGVMHVIAERDGGNCC
jgi:hypothetical protein